MLLAVAVLGSLTIVVLNGSSEMLAARLLLILSGGLSALVISRDATDWPGARSTALLLALMGAGALLSGALRAFTDGGYEPSVWDVLYLAFLAPLALVGRDELRAHFAERERREVTIDVVLIVASIASLLYLVIRPADADAGASVTAAVFAVLATSVITVFGTLALWVPSRAHILLFASFLPAAVAAAQFGYERAERIFDGASLVASLAWFLAPLALAATMTTVEHRDPKAERVASRLAQPVLTSVAVVAAAAALALVAIFDEAQMIAGAQSTLIIVGLSVGVAVRILSNQLASSEAHGEVEVALEHKEAALIEADRALDRVRVANETLRRSEEHLRLVFDAAVDGFVEVDHDGWIVRANEAFATMVGMDRAKIEGERWVDVAARVDGADGSFASLSEGGDAQITRTDGQPLHLESRVSSIPTQPPRRLLLVRDVTAARVADQTIRSLFQFLQDRDEDRTRLLRRTNAAIEQERNRFARDLHDGPVQGVSAASLSLEAALLMIKAGEVDRGIEILARIRQDLAGEADALRRLMAGLRPPVLEERGLMPALKDTLARFGDEHGLHIEFGGTLSRNVPDDLETLAFRVVQEALANVGRHAKAGEVQVYVGTDQNILRIEIEDDGAGFDTAEVRSHLRAGRVGLASMRERVELAGGTFAVRSTKGRGTAVMATIPIDSGLVTVVG
jgi:PAS domain S-box-containing protein